MVAASAPAFATSGNGYNTKDIVLNDKPYSCTVALQGSTSTGARSVCTTEAYVKREHQNVSVKYDTYNYGYVTDTGGARTTTNSSTSYSYYVACSYGTAQAKQILRIDAMVYIYADQTYTLSVTAR